jgi:hypothetical protein
MRVQQHILGQPGSSETTLPTGSKAHWVLLFGSAEKLESGPAIDAVFATHPEAHIIGCTTAGEIAGRGLYDDTLIVTEVELERSTVRSAEVLIESALDSYNAGVELSRKLLGPELAHVFVLSDGLHVNGSELARGLRAGLPEEVVITGGLAGDGSRFGRTVVRLGRNVGEKRIAAIGIYGTQMRVGYGSVGGWDPYGPDRKVTRSAGNVLFELDGQPALDLYKKYLGDQAAQLPSSGLLFPLRVRVGAEAEVVRTILAIDEEKKSLTFAGDVPEGSTARLMKANFDRLIDGAASAASACLEIGKSTTELAVLISCVGRRLVLQQRTEEELESVSEIVGPNAVSTGFYSYGELSPVMTGKACELHNQTMTVTTFSER